MFQRFDLLSDNINRRWIWLHHENDISTHFPFDHFILKHKSRKTEFTTGAEVRAPPSHAARRRTARGGVDRNPPTGERPVPNPGWCNLRHRCIRRRRSRLDIARGFVLVLRLIILNLQWSNLAWSFMLWLEKCGRPLMCLFWLCLACQT